MKFTFLFQPQFGQSWPHISIAIASNLHDITVDSCDVVNCEFDVMDGTNCLRIIYHKTEQETVMENDKIISDQCLRLDKIWVDDVLMEPWFITEGCYYPEYFPGIVQKFPDWPRQIPSQNLWYFPGSYAIHFETPFWPWYSCQRKKFFRSFHADKDAERWENWSGSHNANTDLVQEIYRLLDV